MSGHSKWSKVKHQKESTDAVKGKIFTKIANSITLAVKQGGGTDPSSNFKLRLAIEKARGVNMPKEKIDKAVERGKGKGEESNLEEVVYEVFGPGGVGIIVEAATDSRQRTVSLLKNILERGGGTLAASGAVAHFFNLVGAIGIPKESGTYDGVMERAIEAGASDLEDLGESFEIYTSPSTVHQVKDLLVKGGIKVSSADIIYRAVTTIPVSDRHIWDQLLKLLSSIEDIEDVQKVFSNFDIPDNFLQ